jgi:P27 family predicted phage terminase small subunit
VIENEQDQAANLHLETGSQLEPVKDSGAESLTPADCGSSSCQIGNLPAPPDGVPVEMHAEWSNIVSDLKARRLLNDSMLGVVRSYVMAQWTAAQAEKSISEQGVFVSGAGGAMKPNPATGLLRSSRDMISRLASELGLTPTSRARKSLQPSAGQNDLFQRSEWDL